MTHDDIPETKREAAIYFPTGCVLSLLLLGCLALLGYSIYRAVIVLRAAFE